jgi:lipopolysaccharide export system protein LptA
MLLVATSAWSQEKRPVEILNVDDHLFDDRISDAERLIGNVRLRYENSILTCDSAYKFPNGNFDAYSSVHVTKGDTLQLFGDFLSIVKGENEVVLRDNIRLIDKDMTLTTNDLVYDLTTGKARYVNGGTILSKQNNNVLTSKVGVYDKQTEFFSFRKNVVLKNPEYTIASDTLRYHNLTEIAYVEGPTLITTKESTITCKQGWFNTRTEESRFSRGAEVLSGTNILRGDSLVFDNRRNYGEVFSNVFMRDTTSNYYITGHYGWHDEARLRSLVTDSAMMVQVMDGDSLFLHGDTLRAVPDSLQRRKVLAYHHVKFFKSDLQGKCDSLVFAEQDSTIRMFFDPILWSDENQISGKMIELLLYDSEIHRLDIESEALVVSEEGTERYNQIAGRELVGFFRNSKLHRIDVDGNSQVVYYPEGSTPGSSVGVNRADCSGLTIFVDDNRITKVVMRGSPTGGLHPLSKAAPGDRTLERFFWDDTNRPANRQEIFYKASPPTATD